MSTSARIFLALLLSAGTLLAAERQVLQLKNFAETETKFSGFVLPAETRLHVRALGCGSDRGGKYSDAPMCAYGWIINADTREQVWAMTIDNTRKEKDDRKFDDYITLPKGSYEAYFSAYAYFNRSPFFSYNINIDRRRETENDPSLRKRGFFSWFEDLFTGDLKKEWRAHALAWGMELSVAESSPAIALYTPPKDFPRLLFHAVRLGEDEHLRQGFTLAKEMTIRIYALGERTPGDDPVDYGWIINAETRKRVWDMGKAQTTSAGGAEKNIKCDQTVTLPAGDYILYYTTDDSHSYVDWNAAPPSDPCNYGISLIAARTEDEDRFSLSAPKESGGIIVQLVGVGNNETRNASFTLKKEARLHLYAIGERGDSRRQMADYGWIINAKTREKVWSMDVDQTEHAGGAEKNRMVDEIVTLPAGTYTAIYQTDDSHAYNHWNSAPPFDPEHYGLTISLEGEPLSPSIVEKNVTPAEEGVIAQIVRVGNNANRTERFHLAKSTHIRVYAIGEGQGREMYDYGWIENAATSAVVWEMTYGMTFHAGGGRKNRMVNTTILLDAGDYILHYVSDDSHSYGDWNTDQPDDPTMWGITLYSEK